MEQLEKEMTGFKAVTVMTDQPDWQGEKGRLNAAMLQEHLGSLEKKDFFICGPPAMTDALIFELKELQVSTEKIHSELFQL